MRLDWFKYLIALEQYRSFSKAAQILFIAQPSLSAAVKAMEDELGFEILIRSKKGVSFTAQGEMVLEEAKIIMGALQRIEQIEYQDKGSLKGKLRVGGLPYFCTSLLVNTMLELSQSYPELVLQLVEDDTEHILELVTEESLDLGIVLVSYLDENDWYSEMRKIKLNYLKLFDDKMVFVARADHPLFLKTEVKIEDIFCYPFITHRKSTNPITKKVIEQYNDTTKIMYLSGYHNLLQYLSHSDAISVFPSKTIARNFTASEKIRVIEVNNFNWLCEVGWVSRKEELRLSEKIFIDALIKQCMIFQ